MSFIKICQLSENFITKIAEHHYEDHAPEDCKAKDITWVDEEARREIKENGKNLEYKPFNKSHNPPGSIASEKIWDRAKKAVKKYWKKYDEPWAVVYDVYRKMGGKPKKKSPKKKSEMYDALIQKYSYYGQIKNTTPPQNHIRYDNEQKTIKAVYDLINSLYNEKIQGRFESNPELEDSYNKILEFYHSLLQEGKRPKFDLYDQAISDPAGFSILEKENTDSIRNDIKPTKLDRILKNKNEVMTRHLNEANEAVRNLKQETRS